ncbi:hypothetical protein CsSME_00005891 [Camellia sinensis var. sinensis]
MWPSSSLVIQFLTLETFNVINTTTSFQAYFWPYAETTFNYPTGRSCDGRLIPDFFVKYAKLPLIPPYMKLSNNHQFSIRVNFVSGGAGVVVETFKGLFNDPQKIVPILILRRSTLKHK